ncbi:MAG: hypothetical protein ACTSSJ_00525 [Candidatus Odinarchaeia archaeon]
MEAIGSLLDQLMQADRTILATALIDMSGNILYQTNNWTLSGPEIIAAFKDKAPSIVIHGVRYSTLTVTEDSLIATNIKGQGHIIGTTVGDKGLLLCYATSEGDPKVVYMELIRIAHTINKMI